MIKIPISDLEERATKRPEGYLKDAFSHGKVEGDYLVYTQENYDKLFEKYNRSGYLASRIKNESGETMQTSSPESFSVSPATEMNNNLEDLPLPTIGEMASNFITAFSKWTMAGLPVVTKDTFDKRMAVCRGCPLWSDDARGGLGKCNQPSCGCTKIKFWLATEKCPIDKWGEDII